MNNNPELSFENTAVAFASKSDSELRKTYFLFAMMNQPWLVGFGTAFINIALKLRLPIKGMIRNTIFKHFCGGVSIADAQKTMDLLAVYNINTILDYSAEGEESEKEFEKTTEEQLKLVDSAANSKFIPFTVMKISGISSNRLLEKHQKKETLSDSEKEAWKRVRSRFEKICKKSQELNVRLMIDAEETWIQDPIDDLVYEMMERYNQEKPLIWNTYQMYRHDMLANLKKTNQLATENGYWIGAKLVRGAYMEKERDEAEEYGYTDPIQPDKKATDTDYNAAIKFCLEHKDRIGVFAGTHNEQSSRYLASLMVEKGINCNHPNYWFGQLYGMSDHITYGLAQKGYNVAKYVPYGPIEKVMPYLFRRAEENTSVAGQSAREYLMVKEEMKRRKKA
ncbi:MAG: proline dehydrogenase family protein [Cyclobacteriaceae bacterium]